MPLLAAFFASSFGTLFGFFAKFLTQRVAIGVALTASVLASSVAFYSIIQGLVFGLVSLIENEIFLMYFFAILPSNFATCVTACFSADVAIFIYRHKIRLMTTIAQVG